MGCGEADAEIICWLLRRVAMRWYSFAMYVICMFALVMGILLDVDAKIWSVFILSGIAGLYWRDVVRK